MSSDLDMASGRMRGIAATQVLNRSILGFLSPLSGKERKSAALTIPVKMKEDEVVIFVTHVIISSGSLFSIWTLVSIMQRPTSLSKCLKTLSRDFRTWE